MLFLSAYILFFLCMYVCMYGCVGSSFLWEGSLQLWQAGATLHRGARASHYRGLSLPSTGSRWAGSAIVAHGPSRSAACGILPDQGSNPCPLHWQADSQPLRHQGSPLDYFLIYVLAYLSDLQSFDIFAFPIVFFPFLLILLFYSEKVFQYFF